jgi:membrane protein required for colicin V production
MNWIDLAVFLILLLSGIISFINGFVRELFSLLGWLLSFLITLWFFDDLEKLFTPLFPTPYDDLRLGMSFIVLFFASFILLEIINYLILNSIGRTRLTLSDRILASFFGIIRGGIIVTMIVLLAALTQFPSKIVWQESLSIQKIKPIMQLIRSNLSITIAPKFNFDPPPEQRGAKKPPKSSAPSNP